MERLQATDTGELLLCTLEAEVCLHEQSNDNEKTTKQDNQNMRNKILIDVKKLIDRGSYLAFN